VSIPPEQLPELERLFESFLADHQRKGESRSFIQDSIAGVQPKDFANEQQVGDFQANLGEADELEAANEHC